MRLSKIQLANLGPFDGATLEIPAPEAGQQGELVLFEGPNGSGKTTLMESVVASLQQVLQIQDMEHSGLWPAMGLSR